MKVTIPGGTGQVGTLLARAFHGDGHEVVVLGRSPKPAPWRVAQWDPASLTGWIRELDGADVVINLAGRSVNCRYTPGNRQEILQSRVASVGAVGRAIAEGDDLHPYGFKRARRRSTLTATMRPTTRCPA